MNWESTIPLIAVFLVWTEIRTRNFERRLRRVEGRGVQQARERAAASDAEDRAEKIKRILRNGPA